MKLFAVIILVISLAFIPQISYSKKASTIDELVKMYDITLCATCHEDKYEEWKSSTMGNSVIDPRVLRGWRTFIRLELDEEETMSRKDLTICLGCHVPQIKDATPELVVHISELVITAVEDEDKSKKEAAKKELSKLNLNCLGCHNLRSRGLDGNTKEGTIYVPHDIDGTAHKAAGFDTVKSEYLKTSDFCAQCHHCPPSVPWKQCPDIYTSYIENFIHEGRKETCQDCHMKGEKGNRNHKFFGPEDPDFIRSAIILKMDARPTKQIDTYESRFAPALAIEIELMNNGGHVLPHG